MPEEITFLDLAALVKIKPETTVEKYGGMINSSLFDAANVLGTLSQKKLISFTTAMPGVNPITVTELGKNVMADADNRAEAEFDHLDLAILTQMQNGKRIPAEIALAVNVRAKDLAMHLYKLTKQDYITYEMRSGMVEVMLTEKGFTQVKMGMPIKQQPQGQGMQQPAAATPQQQTPRQEMKPMMQGNEMAGPMEAQPVADPAPDQAQQQQPKMTKGKGLMFGMLVGIVVILIIVVVAYLYLNGMLKI